MTTLTEKLKAESRTDRIIRTGRMTAVDAIVLGVASWFGGVPDGGDAQDMGVNAPLYQDEPSTWCSRCKAQYWTPRCPSCGK